MDLDHAHPEITRMWRNLCWMLHSHWLKSPNSLSEPTLATSPEWIRMSALGKSSATPKVSRPEKHAKKSTKRGFRVVGGHFLLSHIKIYKGTVYIYTVYIYICIFCEIFAGSSDNICRASSESASACQMYLNELVQNGMIWTGRPWLAKGPIWSYQVHNHPQPSGFLTTMKHRLGSFFMNQHSTSHHGLICPSSSKQHQKNI